MIGIYHDLTIISSAEKIMTAVVTPEGFNSWWTKECSGNPVVGEIYNFYFDDEYNWFASVLLYEPGERIEYAMKETSSDWEGTSLSFCVITKGDSECLLRFEHTGWKELTDNFRITSYCWVNYLNNLKRYLEEGVRTPYASKA